LEVVMKSLTNPVPAVAGVLVFAGAVTWLLNALDAGPSVAGLGVLAMALVGGLVASSIASR
jgi:hypothetical protein